MKHGNNITTLNTSVYILSKKQFYFRFSTPIEHLLHPWFIFWCAFKVLRPCAIEFLTIAQYAIATCGHHAQLF